MYQKSIDKRSPLEAQDALWAAIRRMKSFTFDEVRGKTLCSHCTTTEYLAGLTAAGYLQLDAESRYHLVRDVGVDAPQVGRDGNENIKGRERLQIWTVLPIMKEFSVLNVVLHAGTETVPVAESTVRHYLKCLHKAGYISIVKPTQRRSVTRYRFLQSKYTGPKPPMIQTVKQVFDPNTGKVMWSQGRGL